MQYTVVFGMSRYFWVNWQSAGLQRPKQKYSDAENVCCEFSMFPKYILVYYGIFML